jgi:arginyl-tRNA--protein-N-Asp/Glu arginylyltransferase
MLSTDFRYIHEEFDADLVTPEQMDVLWSDGWRHFGTHFFRYNLGLLGEHIRYVIPLRIDLANFKFSKSQRRIMRSNSDLTAERRPIKIDTATEELFHRHKQRFKHSVPRTLYDFLSRQPDVLPSDAQEFRVYSDKRLIAVSFFDLGASSASGIYGMFEPDESHRSLGTFTMLKEIELAIDTGRRFYYQGYAYAGESFYDYKKRFRGTEAFDWNGNWYAYDRSDEASR